MPKKPPRVLVTAAPRADGLLSLVQVHDGGCVLSNGHELIIPWTKLQSLAESICQDGSPIWIRIWTRPDGDELIELRRHGAEFIDDSSAPNPAPSEEAF